MPHTREQQGLLFPIRPHTRYTGAVERLIEKMRHGFLEFPDLERRLIELGIFERDEEIDLLWAHMIYGNNPMPNRNHVMDQLWNPLLRTLETLDQKGLRGLPSARRELMRCVIEGSSH